MPSQYWLLLAAALALLCAQRVLRRAVSRALMGHSRCWRLRLAADGTLRARGCRLRLYGIDSTVDAAAILGQSIDGKRLRWRVVAVDYDGTLAIVLRADGRNVAVDLLRLGIVAVRGSGARRYRCAQAQAGVARLGLWRHGENGSVSSAENSRRVALSFPWWQG